MVYLFSRRAPGALPRLAEIVLVCFLCFVLCVGCYIRPARAVGTGATVAVAGGAIGTGGISALGALGTLLVPTLGVIGAVLLGAGINVYVTEQSAAQGMTKSQFLETSLRQWVSERGGSFDDLISTIAEGIHVSPLGEIALSGAASLLIYQFGNWLFANDKVSNLDSSGTVVSPNQYVLLGNFSFIYRNSNDIYELDLPSGVAYSVIREPSNTNCKGIVYSYSPFSFKFRNYSVNNQPGSWITITWNQGSYGHYVYNDYWGNPVYILNLTAGSVGWYFDTVPIYRDGTTSDGVHDFILSISPGDLTGTTAIADNVFTGTEQDWLDNRDLLKPGDGDVVTLQNAPDLIGGAADALTSGAYNVSVPDYLSALTDAYNNALAAEASIPLTLTDTATGAVVSEGISVTTPFADAALSTSVAPTDTAGAFIAPDVSVDAGEAVGVMAPDLTTIFPFCIPFDMARILNLLAADPVIPQYHVRWAVPYLQQPIEFDIDLTPLDGVMSVARAMETLLFVVGLALASRQMYLRG